MWIVAGREIPINDTLAADGAVNAVSVTGIADLHTAAAWSRRDNALDNVRACVGEWVADEAREPLFPTRVAGLGHTFTLTLTFAFAFAFTFTFTFAFTGDRGASWAWEKGCNDDEG